MSTKNNMKLWGDERFVELGRVARININTIGVAPLLKSAVRDRKQIFETKVEGSIAEKESTFVEYIEKLGGTLFYKKIVSKNTSSQLFTWEDGMLELYITPTYVSAEVVSLKEELVLDIHKFVKKHLLPAKTRGSVYAIVYQGGRLAMSNLGVAGIPLVEQNYTPQVLKDFRFSIQDLNSSYPSGRLVVLEGEPGTGKTHLVRAMLDEVTKGMFVLVPPDMVKSLGGPELLPLLMQYHNYHAGPIILVLEDADKCLVTRAEKDTDTGVIQSILNLGDGIMGSMLDIRIVATTNAKKFEMDPAVLRRGRLSKQIHVGPLDLESALRAYGNLLPGKPYPTELTTNPTIPLSDVYGIARDNGWKPKENDRPEENHDEEDDDYYDEDDDADEDDLD